MGFCLPRSNRTQHQFSDFNDAKTNICDASEGIIETIIGYPEEEEIKNVHSRFSSDNFIDITLLGEGGFSQVHLVKSKKTSQYYFFQYYDKLFKDKLYAMKIQQKPKPINGRYTSLLFSPKTERDILSKISHPFIVNLCFAFQSKTKLYLVTDFIKGGELSKHIPETGFDEIKAIFIASEIVLALEYLHHKGIIYRDLKPGNILMDLEGHIKIIDFGISKEEIYDNGRTYTKCGTPEYLAPEIYSSYSNLFYNFSLVFGYDKTID